jgi:hypothetical protein
VTVHPGRRYAFRYHASNGDWFNDETVVDFAPNELGGLNCVIDLTDGAG